MNLWNQHTFSRLNSARIHRSADNWAGCHSIPITIMFSRANRLLSASESRLNMKIKIVFKSFLMRWRGRSTEPVPINLPWNKTVATIWSVTYLVFDVLRTQYNDLCCCLRYFLGFGLEQIGSHLNYLNLPSEDNGRRFSSHWTRR